MAQHHGCGYYSGQAFIEMERIRSLADKQNAEAIDNHLTLIEKEIDKTGLLCGIIDLSVEKEHLGNIRLALKDKQFHKIEDEASDFEKGLITKLAKGHNEGGDPMDVIPSRLWDSL